MNVNIRLATRDDLPAINAIYNHFVLHSTCTYQIEPSTLAEREQWFEAHGQTHPVTVAEAGGAGGVEGQVVVGWGSLSPFHPRAAYRHTAENSIYVQANMHRRGIGGMLLADLMQRAHMLACRSVVAIISADQTASVALHARHGFREAGRLLRVGYKFDKWLDVLYMQREFERQDA